MYFTVNIGGIPHLAKNERDMGHPSLVREPERIALLFLILFKVETLSGLPSAPRGCVRPQVPVLTQTLHGMSENRDLEIESSGPIHVEKISQFWLLQIAKMTLQIKRSDTRGPAHEISVRATRRIRDDRVA